MTSARPGRDQARAAERAAARPGRGRWPIPNDTPTDRARTIAGGLLDALRRVDPDQAAAFQQRAHDLGETWVGAAPPITGRLLSRDEVAALYGVRPHTVSMWTSRGRLTRLPGGYDEKEVHALRARSRTGTPRPAQPQDQE